VKCFLGLSYDRAYKRFYPAIDPLISWSRYLRQLEGWASENMGADWTDRVEEVTAFLKRGDEIARMEQVTGEEGISVEDFVVSEAAKFIDMVYLQQDAFDEIDSSVSLERQKALFERICSIALRDYGFTDKEAVRRHFTRLTSLFRNLNYAAPGSPDAERLTREIDEADNEAPTIARVDSAAEKAGV